MFPSLRPAIAGLWRGGASLNSPLDESAVADMTKMEQQSSNLENLRDFPQQSWSAINEAGVNLQELRACFDFLAGRLRIEDSA